jgi:hypothetical protein
MEQYRVYDRQTLAFVDGGIVRDYNVDFDFLANNASTLTLVEETYAKKGDILAIIKGVDKLCLGCITAVDNTKKTISFKHMKELFNDKVLNVFFYTNIIGKKFDAIGAMKTILEYGFVTTDDTRRRLPLDIIMQGSAQGAVWLDEAASMNVLDFIHKMFDNYNVYVDFDLDFVNNKITVRIVKNTTEGLVIKNNIKLSEPQFDNNETPNVNKLILYRKDNGNIVGTYYLLKNNTVTTSSTNVNRILPVATKYVEFDSVKAAEDGYTMLDVANSELVGNIYNHCVQMKLSKEQNLVKPFDFKLGDKVTIIYEEREYDSIFTGLKFKKDSPYITCIFGKTRIDFSDRLKQYINKEFRKK